MFPNLGHVSENQRHSSNQLLYSRRSFVREKRNGLLNTGELRPVMSGRDGETPALVEKGGPQARFACMSHAGWARARWLHETPNRARFINYLALKSWVKVWLWVQILALPHTVLNPLASDPNAPGLSFLLCQRRVIIEPTLLEFYEDYELAYARWSAQCLARGRHDFIGTIW